MAMSRNRDLYGSRALWTLRWLGSLHITRRGGRELQSPAARNVATQNLLARSRQHLRQLPILDHGGDVLFHQITPFHSKLGQRFHIIAFQ
jgi:hypothetical protein